jgi:replicative DNA helicase
MKPKQKPEVSEIIYHPEKAGKLAVQFVQDLYDHKNEGIPLGLPDVDKILVPLRAGWLVTVIGYTSNLKSTFMDWIGLKALETIPPESNKFVCKVTWEQSVEEDTLGWIASKSNLSVTKMARGLIEEPEWDILRGTATKRAATPLWIIGHSQMEFKAGRRARPRMTMRDVAKGLEYIIHDSTPDIILEPSLVILDYLQRMRSDPQDGGTRREQMMEAVNLSKDLAVSYGCPVILGVQSSREVLSRGDKIPTLQDGQETSNIEQSSDASFGCWYPIKSEKEGNMIDGWRVNKNLFFLRLLKQKLGEAPATWALHVDPERRIFANMSHNHITLDQL